MTQRKEILGWIDIAPWEKKRLRSYKKRSMEKDELRLAMKEIREMEKEKEMDKDLETVNVCIKGGSWIDESTGKSGDDFISLCAHLRNLSLENAKVSFLEKCKEENIYASKERFVLFMKELKSEFNDQERISQLNHAIEMSDRYLSNYEVDNLSDSIMEIYRNQICRILQLGGFTYKDAMGELDENCPLDRMFMGECPCGQVTYKLSEG